MKNFLFRWLLLIVVVLLVAPPTSIVEAKKMVTIDLNESFYLEIGKKIIRVTSGNPAIAQVKKIDDMQTGFLIEGHGAGTTAILVWTDDDKREEYLIVVSPEDIGQARLIEKAIGLPDVHVKKVGDRILLTGTVANQYEKNYAVQVVMFYIGGGSVALNTGSNVDLELGSSIATIESQGQIVDLLRMINPTMIKLDAQVIDISTSDSKDLGIRYGESSSSSGSISINPGVLTAGESYSRRDGGGSILKNPISWIDHHRANLNLSLNALIENGKARVLSRPSIVTLSGEQATIQIGGKIPYTTVSTNGTATTSFEDYGIILRFKPIVDADNRVTASIHAEVSNMSGESVDGQPIISTRQADAVVNLDSGSTMLIGGLMDSSEVKNVTKIPLLSAIPILGEFFKYTSKSRDNRELIVLITPTIVEDRSRARMSTPMKEWYQRGQLESNRREVVDLDDEVLDEPFVAE